MSTASAVDGVGRNSQVAKTNVKAIKIDVKNFIIKLL
jgi:hypothetical protein